MFKYLALALIVLALVPLPVQSKSDLALLRGQQCVAEVSLAPRVQVAKKDRVRQKIEECVLMWSVLRTRAQRARKSQSRVIRRYNTLFKRSDTRRIYVFDLNPVLSEPVGWPKRLIWDRYKTMWSEIYEAAQKFELRNTPHPCPKADQYGGRCDDEDHACDTPPPCWERQWCGRPVTWFSQAYYKERKCDATIPANLAASL